MNADYQIPEPFLFNPVKHHLGFIKEFITLNIENSSQNIELLTMELKHLGTCVMDIYNGLLSIEAICSEANGFLKEEKILSKKKYSEWTGINPESFRIITISDGSQWTLKFQDDPLRYVHLFPARNSLYTFRVKSTTMKSALIYNIIIGKDLVTGEDLNKVRPIVGLPPVKNSIDVESILEMIDILRG